VSFLNPAFTDITQLHVFLPNPAFIDITSITIQKFIGKTAGNFLSAGQIVPHHSYKNILLI